jgi:polysaccharide pyruvyl transferase WcaK-like protein
LPDEKLLCICTGPDEVTAKYGISTFPLRMMPPKIWSEKKSIVFKALRRIFIRIPSEWAHWFEAIKILKECRMLIVTGTGILVDHTTGPFGYPYLLFKWSIIAKLCRCKLLFVSVGAGPIYHKVSRWFIKCALKLSSYRSYRDDFSKQYIETIGFKGHGDPIYPDLAFSLPKSIMLESGNHDRKGNVVGVGLMDYYGKENKNSIHKQGGQDAIYSNYMRKLYSFVTRLFEEKFIVRLLIGDVKYDSSVKKDLLQLIEKNGPKYEVEQIINEPIYDLVELLPQLAKSDIVVSPRFHNIILALMLNIPVISISYNKKFESLMKEFGLNEYCLAIEHLNVNWLLVKIREIKKKADKIIPQIQQKTQENRKALDEQYSIIFNAILPE